MIPDKNFRLKKPFKSMIALSGGSKEDRNQLKKMLIDAQLHEEAAHRAALKSKDHKSKEVD
jgi:hypothetical protein